MTLEGITGELAVLGPQDLLLLRANRRLTAEESVRIADHLKHVVGKERGRVLVLDNNFDVLIQRGET